METLYQEYKDQGFVIIAMYPETESATVPTTEELKAWADNYGMTFPVVADSGWAVSNLYEVDYGIPTQSVFSKGEVIEVEDGDGEGNVPNYLPK